MRRVLLCYLLVLLTACANTPARQSGGAGATATVAAGATAIATRADAVVGTEFSCPTATPVKGVAMADGARRSLVSGEPGYDDLPWVRCFATTAAAEAAGFARPRATSATNGATPGSPTATVVAAADEFATVVRVLDGATIEVRLADGRLETVRYLGVATPDEADPGAAVACYGAEATARNRVLVEGKRVRLERDVSPWDRFERPVRYVWVTGDDGATRMANVELVRGGDAAAAVRPPDVRYQQLFLDAEREARGAGLGLWRVCAGSPTPIATPTATAPATPSPPTPTPPVPTATPVPPAPAPSPPPQAPTATPLPPPPLAAPTVTATAPSTATALPAAPTQAQPAATATRVPPTATRVPPTATKIPAPTPTPVPKPSCHPSYPTLCLPGSPDLDCIDIPQKNFPVKPPDPHRLDADKDGIGCEG